MSVQEVREVVRNFLSQTENEVLAIKGTWGVGKTYAWHRFVSELKATIKPKIYSYVSLFGITSIADLRMAILSNSIPTEGIGSRMMLSSVNRNWWPLAVAQVNALRRKLPDLDGGTKLKNVYVTFDALMPSLIKKRLICFDDFERLNTKKLSHEELMGFIATLRENAHCKIAIILNDAKVSEQNNMYQVYREKVIDTEIRFDPTVDEAISWGLREGMPYFQQTKDCAKLLDVRNVRILKKADSVVTSVAPAIDGKLESVVNTVIRSAVLLTWSYYEKTGLAPSLEFIKSTDLMSDTLGRQKKKGEAPKSTPQEDRWAGMLSAYRFGYYDKLDEALIKVIEQGYLQGSGLEREVSLREEDESRGNLHGRFSAAWSLFHDLLDDNEPEVVSALREGFKATVAIQTSGNLNAVVALLRELDQEPVADELITFYIEKRGEDRDILDLDNDTFGNQVSDPTIRAAFAAKLATFSSQSSLRQTLEKMATTNSWTTEDEKLLATATEDDFYKLLKERGPVTPYRLVSAARRFNQPPWAHIAQRADQALRRLGGESRINRIRMHSYGIDLSEPDDPES